MSFSDFIHMGGYGNYVWSAYGFVALVLILNTVLPIVRHRRLLREAKLQHGANDS